MKTNYILLPLLALTLAACDQPAPKNDKPANPNETTAPQDDKKADKPATDNKTEQNSDKKSEKPAADSKTEPPKDNKTDKPAEAKTETKTDKPDAGEAQKGEKPGDAPAEPAPPPVFKTAEEALPYIQSQLPYDTKESSFRTVALDKGVFTFTAVIKGVEDAAAFQASHNMEALTGAYQQNIKPYICEQEPLKSLWQKTNTPSPSCKLTSPRPIAPRLRKPLPPRNNDMRPMPKKTVPNRTKPATPSRDAA